MKLLAPLLALALSGCVVSILPVFSSVHHHSHLLHSTVIDNGMGPPHKH